jgi:hypothetical protein
MKKTSEKLVSIMTSTAGALGYGALSIVSALAAIDRVKDVVKEITNK